MFIVTCMSLTSKILIGMITGFVLGIFFNSLNLSHTNPINLYLVDGFLDTGGQIFLSLLRLMVVPLVFFSLVSGVASLENNNINLNTSGRFRAFSQILEEPLSNKIIESSVIV